MFVSFLEVFFCCVGEGVSFFVLCIICNFFLELLDLLLNGLYFLGS